MSRADALFSARRAPQLAALALISFGVAGCSADMSISQVDFDLTSIAALLTILGYSLNDTVVIYDRIREMLRRYKKMPMPQLLNESINSTLSRSIITHVTVTLALLALLLFGGHDQ